jgi:hypothetical protein
MPHLRLLRLASRGAKFSRREKRWSRRVVEHSVLAPTIVSQDFLDLSATGIRFGRFLVCGPRTPFLLDHFLHTRVPYRNSMLRTFVSGTCGIGGARVKPFSCARDSCRTSGAAFAVLIVCRLRMSLGVDTTRFSKEECGWSLTNR